MNTGTTRPYYPLLTEVNLSDGGKYPFAYACFQISWMRADDERPFSSKQVCADFIY